MRFPNKLYDALKWICLIFLPAVGVLLATVLPACGVEPETVRVIVLVLGAIETFIGALIGVSTAAYKAEQNGIETVKVGGSE